MRRRRLGGAWHTQSVHRRPGEGVLHSGDGPAQSGDRPMRCAGWMSTDRAAVDARGLGEASPRQRRVPLLFELHSSDAPDESATGGTQRATTAQSGGKAGERHGLRAVRPYRPAGLVAGEHHGQGALEILDLKVPLPRQSRGEPTKRKGARPLRQHQKQILSVLYRATEESESKLSLDFLRWAADIARVRGELDRKKKVAPGAIEALLGAEVPEPELARFIYAAEHYMLLRATATIAECAPQALAEPAARCGALGKALTITKVIDDLLAERAPTALATERQQVRELVHEVDGPLEDLFQTEYARLIPREVRHAIGSFYTPQWLARHVLRSAGYLWENPKSLMKVLCDPACGSGVFLVAAAEEIRQAAASGLMPHHDAMELVAKNLRGIDIELVPCILATASLTLACYRIAQSSSEPLDVPVPVTISHADSLSTVAIPKDVDLLVGNPPWVNWEYMPAEYRHKHRGLWPALGIFTAAGKAMAFSKEDISALFVAHSIHYRLKPGGTFAFVLPESLLKSAMNHRDFRRFRLGPGADPYRVTMAEDFVKTRPFEGVANRTVVLYGREDGATQYPLPYREWGTLDRRAQPLTGSRSLVAPVAESMAQLADANDPMSSWSTGHLDGLAAHRLLDGKNPYRGRTGLFTGGANAVYHLRLLGTDQSGSLTVENVVERAKRAAPVVVADIEDHYVFRFLRGRDVRQWYFDSELLVLLPHTAATRMAPVAPDALAQTAPRTLAYLSQFRDVLDARKGFSKWEQPFLASGFYACQRVGDYTFADWKVVWRYISPRFTTAVVGPCALPGSDQAKPVIPNEKLMLIACSGEDEAYYVGGVLAGAVVVEHVHSRMVSTQVSPSIVASIGMPLWDPSDPLHRDISSACRVGHHAVSRGEDVAGIIDELDGLVGRIWGLPDQVARAARARVGY